MVALLMGGERAVCYPGDPRHSMGQSAFAGPTRLTYRNGRFEPDAGFETLFDWAVDFPVLG